jgi:hypothetical protein
MPTFTLCKLHPKKNLVIVISNLFKFIQLWLLNVVDLVHFLNVNWCQLRFPGLNMPQIAEKLQPQAWETTDFLLTRTIHLIYVHVGGVWNSLHSLSVNCGSLKCTNNNWESHQTPCHDNDDGVHQRIIWGTRLSVSSLIFFAGWCWLVVLSPAPQKHQSPSRSTQATR